MTNLQKKTTEIYEPILEDLQEVETTLLESADSSYMKPFLKYVTKIPGKRIRPILTLLSSKFNKTKPENPILMATAVELLHLATLIHDDTVDKSNFRRGIKTPNNIWGNQIAVLLGDYIFAKSATYVCKTKNVRAIQKFSETIMDLSSGQLAEYLLSFKPNLQMNEYNERIYQKTASLFETSCETGAILSGIQENSIKALSKYGYHIGMAFQLSDDLLDFTGNQEDTGKPVSNDLKQGTITLPIIYFQQKSPDNKTLEHFFQTKNAKDVKAINTLIMNSGVINDCYKVVQQHIDKALIAIKNLPDNKSKTALEFIAKNILNRKS